MNDVLLNSPKERARRDSARTVIDAHEVYDPAARQALGGEAAMPRYLLGTAETGYPHNINFTLYHSLAQVSDRATGEANEHPPWLAVMVVDLDSETELRVDVDVQVMVRPFDRDAQASDVR